MQCIEADKYVVRFHSVLITTEFSWGMPLYTMRDSRDYQGCHDIEQT